MRLVIDTDLRYGGNGIIITNVGEPTVEELCILRDLFDTAMQRIASEAIESLNTSKNGDK